MLDTKIHVFLVKIITYSSYWFKIKVDILMLYTSLFTIN